MLHTGSKVSPGHDGLEDAVPGTLPLRNEETPPLEEIYLIYDYMGHDDALPMNFWSIQDKFDKIGYD